MGTKPSRTSRSDANSDIMVIQNNIQPLVDEPTERYLILGPSDSGKSTLFHWAQRISSEQKKDDDDKNIRMICSWVVERIWETMGEQERSKFKEIIPDIRSIFENTDESRIATEIEEREDCCNILITLWKNQFIRDFYESVWSKDASPMFENVKELVSNLEQKKIFAPFSLVHCRTTGILAHNIKRKNTKIELIDVGGRRNERKKWIHCFEDNRAIIYMVSLSEFNQVLMEDNNTNRVDESLILFKEVLTSRWFSNSRKIILFVKPDILKKKLENGVQYNRELNSNILPELERITDYNLRTVVNSIITEFFKRLEGTKIDSYHIVNTTTEEDIRSVCEILFGERTAQKTTFISPCFLAANNRMKLSLYNYCLKEKLTDVHIITTNDDEDE